jgi:hypothetical protein
MTICTGFWRLKEGGRGHEEATAQGRKANGFVFFPSSPVASAP